MEQSPNLTGWTTSITNLRGVDSPIGIVSTNLPITGIPAEEPRGAMVLDGGGNRSRI